MTTETALWIYYEHARKELEAKRNHDIVICDRSIFDSCVYAEYFHLSGLRLVSHAAQMHLAKEYDQIFFIRPDIKLQGDGVRSTSEKFQLEIDQIFQNYFHHDSQFKGLLIQMNSSDIFNQEENSWKQYCSFVRS